MRSATPPDVRTVPRGRVIDQQWAELGDAVATLSNPQGRPLARTVKLILDPLVLRPTQNPHLAAGAIAEEHVEDLRARLAAAAPLLAATAAWFRHVKQARRAARITEGNPQDLYFQRCFELATTEGAPGPDAERLAAEVLADVHGARGATLAQVRAFVTDAEPELTEAVESAWRARAVEPGGEHLELVAVVLDTCAERPDAAAFAELVRRQAGTGGGARLGLPGTARELGLTDRVVPEPPALGYAASKNRLPKPFDRTVVERMFASAPSWQDSVEPVPDLVRAEISRSAQPWQLADETGRVVLVLARTATEDLTDLAGGADTDAARRLRSRWRREAYVHRVLRSPAELPDALRDQVIAVREAYLRRLWARLHGRELRHDRLDATQLWDLLDGVLRSVILDQRDRLRAVLLADARMAS